MSGEQTIEGVLRRFVFRNEQSGFAIARIELASETDPVTVKGVLTGIEQGERVRIQGRWVEDPRWGRQMVVQSFLPVTPSTARGVEDFLRSGRVKGIGKVFAKRLVEHFGGDTLDVLENHPARLTEVDGIGAGRAKQIVAAWRGSQVDKETLIFLQGLGLPGGVAGKVARVYGKRTIEMVRGNPYRLAAEVSGVGFLTADRIARELGIEPGSPHRLRAGLLFALSQATSDGHCYLPDGDLEDRAVRLLGQPWPSIAPFVEELAGELALVVEVPREGPRRIFLTERHEAEEIVAQRMGRLLGRGAPTQVRDPGAAVTWAEQRSGITLTPGQRAAVERSLTERVLVVTGGPGTGKTTIVRTVLDLWERLGLRVRLGAPTGRAARRLEEATTRTASTLHRLLEFSPRDGQFLRDQDTPLQCDAVVIDEASMIDIDLAAAVLLAVPDGARLLLVGDIDQLPSVGPGSVLGDVIRSGAVPVARLDLVMRQDESGLIVANAHRILQGQRPVSASSADGDFFFIRREDPEEALRTVAHLVAQRIPGRWGLDPLLDVQVLVPMRRGSCGAEALNLALRRGLTEARVARTGEAPAPDDVSLSRRPRLHDRVMQTRNNYDKEVFNGDVGIVTDTAEGGRRVRVRFEDGRVLDYAGEEVEQLDLAYAVTIHKSQGSEYPAVVIPLLTQHFRMLQRNLLYTAITRGKRIVVLVGSQRAVDLAIRNADADVRYTALAERIARAAR